MKFIQTIYFINIFYASLKASGSLTCGSLSIQNCSEVYGSQKICDTTIRSLVVSSPAGFDRNETGEVKQAQFSFSSNETQLARVVTTDRCHLTLCDDQDLMGYCVQFSPGVDANRTEFDGILQAESDVLTGRCACQPISEEAKVNDDDDDHFDRNYIGVVFSPYDKYWETWPNGTKYRIEWKNYTLDEVRSCLEMISTKFSYISTFGIGTVSNTTEWYEGDKIAFVPQLSAEINAKAGYPLLRASIGIFRKDDVKLKWSSKELYNAIEASKVANRIYNGTVWGITVTSEYVIDSVKAHEVLQMIDEVRKVIARDNLRLKVGIRLDKCFEFIAAKRPEDDSSVPTYQASENNNPHQPLTSFQSDLHKIANRVDYILCITFPLSTYSQLPLSSVIEVMQKKFFDLRETLHIINPKLKLIIETGIPSEGVGNGFKNSLSNLRSYWYGMAEFAKREQILFHMFEGMDQPWKNIEDQQGEAYEKNSPNGTDAHNGWWRRANNSDPPVYIEKVTEIGNSPIEERTDTKLSEGTSTTTPLPPVAIALLAIVFGFIGLMLVSMGYLMWKLRMARRQVISREYIQQFHRGGDDCNTSTDSNYAVALRIPYDRKIELAKGSFTIDKSAVIGSGQSGVVLRGTIIDRQPVGVVAFKCTTAASSVADVKSLMSEIKILSYIGQHENLVCILGAYTKKIERGIVYVALEYSPLGSLEKFLKKISNHLKNVTYVNVDEGDGVINPGYVTTAPAATTGYVCTSLAKELSGEVNDNNILHQIDVPTFLQWSYQIASAMEFVSAKKVIHADLAARNILLTTLDHVKLSDFGLSRKLYQEFGVMHDKDTPLPWRWMAPESLKNLVFSTETDVWSYGVTVWEIFSLAEEPYHGVPYNMNFADGLCKGILRLPRATYSTDLIHEQLLQCWNVSPLHRPNFTELKRVFKSILQGYTSTKPNQSHLI